ncbi:tRNA (guanine-N(7)-)-methyltransferase non-catalytic subunit wdr4-like isoform X1 [Myxocyprinus asiaticus]|uniref:tRNA (guanine-N(7)-)-methyltransferase non-catalytic subunit wdr4-like isoform X1 n=1 Tax=Myxocyprinus asiaticus TaxID=70543 RepID=UPI002223A2C5|nr:tRNA (guanine-N(7)-)-methyltransferase non-catalytic subunit wdr4-like isoform X1 [Myxocyprinus asiaticus]XP_051565864.1 tRNA (guanine-N(7)-)-methyltransferase non-catalytic subunit wdr4-like isoform X1 [Myxocyprinus asiaticus]
MAVVCSKGDWFVSSCSTTLVAINLKQTREPFVFDCAKAEKRPKETEGGNTSSEGGPEENDSDRILAFAVSASGKHIALTDDHKRLILFCTEPSWQCISTRWVVRRCTSLVFTQGEDEVFVADKSGDVYSFSVLEPQKPGELKLGHLSMLLAVTLSTDDKYIITADRDEKIRVSFRRAPYNIQAFCLGHREFVSALLVPAGHPDLLLSGSGDGTMKVWHYETGRRLQSIDVRQLGILQNSDADTEKRFAVSRITSSPDGRHVAVQCERFSSVQLFLVDPGTEGCLNPAETLALPLAPWDMTFDSQNQLWLLLESEDVNVLLYRYSEQHWKLCDTETPELKRATEALQAQWNIFKGFVGLESQFKHLYKVNFDNMASYLQKKQERLEQENKKRAAANGSKHNVAGKRSKKEGNPVSQSTS